MTDKKLNLLFTTGLFLLAFGYLSQASATKLYRWVDENGEVHYGDRVPPEEVKLKRDLLNKYESSEMSSARFNAPSPLQSPIL